VTMGRCLRADASHFAAIAQQERHILADGARWISAKSGGYQLKRVRGLSCNSSSR
jgi:hypothetical protein